MGQFKIPILKDSDSKQTQCMICCVICKAYTACKNCSQSCIGLYFESSAKCVFQHWLRVCVSAGIAAEGAEMEAGYGVVAEGGAAATGG